MDEDERRMLSRRHAVGFLGIAMAASAVDPALAQQSDPHTNTHRATSRLCKTHAQNIQSLHSSSRLNLGQAWQARWTLSPIMANPVIAVPAALPVVRR
jgi:hypothetical protein